MERITTSLKPYRAEQLKQLADDKNLSVSQLVSGIIIHYLNSQGMPEQNTDVDSVTRMIWEKVGKLRRSGREVSEVILVRSDPHRHLPPHVQMLVAQDLNNCAVVDDPILILDKILHATMPDGIIALIKSYGQAKGYKGKTLAIPLTLWLDTLKYSDVLTAEVNDEFQSLQQEATADEAINRTTR